MDALKTHFQSRIRNQISNVILFGSMIGITACGLISGITLGTLFISRTFAHDWMPVFQLLTIVMFTVGGFSLGIFASLYMSPFVLRYAFFAKKIGTLNDVSIYSATNIDALIGPFPKLKPATNTFGFLPGRSASAAE
jgi:CBS domain containing-hemolysin-like protein